MKNLLYQYISGVDKKHYILLFGLILINWFSALPQYIPVHPTNKVYDFLDEMSNIQAIDFSTFSKPYSRKNIYDILSQINDDALNQRQKKELYFYLKDFTKECPGKIAEDKRLDLFYYADSTFHITVNPILGGTFMTNESGTAYHWWNGAEAWATYKKWGFWGSLRDNHESELLTQPDYLNQNYGGANFKQLSSGQVDYWETRAGISYNFDIGHIAIMKDHFIWGSNYHGSNILSGRTPSLPHINLFIKPAKWFEFRFVHAWLTSMVVDSTRSFLVTNSYGTDYRKVYHSKFFAANLFTFKPGKRIDLSIGNSIIYDYDNVQLAYLIPIMFYKAVDHQLNSGISNMNSQMFFDISARPLKSLHLYSTLFIDELAIKRITNPDEHNFFSFKAGFHISDFIPNFYAGAEYTFSNALVFRHNVPTTTFESNLFNLGHYLKDNARELFINVGFRPIKNINISLSYNYAAKGPDHTLLGTMPRNTINSFSELVWTSKIFQSKITWHIFNDIYLNISYLISNTEGENDYLELWTAPYFQGRKNTFNIGINIGF